ncbi:hypothetical protein ACJ41O_013837 [Fusarium nematophilum]
MFEELERISPEIAWVYLADVSCHGLQQSLKGEPELAQLVNKIAQQFKDLRLKIQGKSSESATIADAESPSTIQNRELDDLLSTSYENIIPHWDVCDLDFGGFPPVDQSE